MFSPSDLPHFANLVIFMYVFYLRAKIWWYEPRSIDVLSVEFVSFRYVGEIYKKMRSLNAFNMFLSWVKVFRYLAFIPAFSQLTRTLQGAAANLGGFFFIVLLTMVGSA